VAMLVDLLQRQAEEFTIVPSKDVHEAFVVAEHGLNACVLQN